MTTREQLDRKAHADAVSNNAPLYCTWFVVEPVAEPDSAADAYREVPCGAPVTYDHGGWTCAAGHDHRTYGGPDHDELAIMAWERSIDGGAW